MPTLSLRSWQCLATASRTCVKYIPLNNILLVGVYLGLNKPLYSFAAEPKGGEQRVLEKESEMHWIKEKRDWSERILGIQFSASPHLIGKDIDDQRSLVQCSKPHGQDEKRRENQDSRFYTPRSVLCPLPQCWNPNCHWDLPAGPGQVATILDPSCLTAHIYLRGTRLRASDEIVTVKCQANRQAIFKYKKWTVFHFIGKTRILN